MPEGSLSAARVHAPVDVAVDVAAMFAKIAQDLMARPGFQETIDGIVETAVALIGGCEYAGIMIVQPGGRVASPAATGRLVLACDAEQVRTGEGPCLSVTRFREPVIRVDDLATDRRWPRFAAAALGLGVRSILACDLTVARSQTAALNLYSTRVGAFDGTSVELGQIFAMHASMAMARASLEAQLRAAVDSRAGIGQAIGILMERHRATPEQAFEMLKVASQNLNIRLRELAEQVVRTGVEPADAERPSSGATG